MLRSHLSWNSAGSNLHESHLSASFLRRTAVALVSFALVLLALPAAGNAAQKGLSVDLTWADSLAEQNTTEPIIAESGAKYVRMTLNWSDAEPKRGEFNSWWIAQYDNAVNLAHAAGAKIIFVVGSSPSWASGSSNTETPPKNPSEYAEFIHTMAARYAGRVAAWEIWNEENTTRFWSTGPNAAAYTQLLKAAYPAVKSADPSALVLFGGTSLSDYKFVAEAYADGAKGSFDVMADHPYSCRAPGTIVRDSSGNISEDSFLGYRSIHNVMVANGDEKPIWFTEFGWSSSTGGSCEVGATNQANYLTEAYKLTDQDPYVQVACWYNLRNDYWMNNENSVEAQYGLLNTNFTPKPAYAAFKAYTPGSGAGSEPAKTEEPTTSGGSSSGSKSSKHNRHSTTTLVSTSSTKSGAHVARASAARRHRGAHVVKGVVLGARRGRVVFRFQRFVPATHSWVSVSSVTEQVRHGHFSVRVAGHMVPQRMRVRVSFDGTATAAPSSSHYVTFTA